MAKINQGGQLLLQKGQNRAGHCGGSVALAKLGDQTTLPLTSWAIL